VEPAALREVLDGSGFTTLRRLGVLHSAGGDPEQVFTSASLTPLRDRLFLADQRWERANLPVGSGGPATPPQMDTDILLRITPRRPVRHTLDMTTGSGPHALAAAAHSSSVVGTDIAARPLAYAQVNARLNGIENCRFRQADVTRQETDLGTEHDLVLSNPPFVVGPDREMLFRDGGPLGDDVLGAILGRLPELLAADGQARIVTQLALRRHETIAQKLEAFLSAAGLDRFDIVVVTAAPHDLVDYAMIHGTRIRNGQTEWTAAEADRLRRHLAEVDVAAIVPAAMALNRVPRGGSILHRTARDLLLLEARHFDRLFSILEHLRSIEPWSVLRPCRYRLNPAVRLVHEQAFEPQPGDRYMIQFAPPSPWDGCPVSPDLGRCVEHCAGGVSGAELGAVLATAEGIDAEQVRRFLCRALPELLLHGVLELDA